MNLDLCEFNFNCRILQKVSLKIVSFVLILTWECTVLLASWVLRVHHWHWHETLRELSLVSSWWHESWHHHWHLWHLRNLRGGGCTCSSVLLSHHLLLHCHLLGEHCLILLEHLLVKGHLLVDELLLIHEHLILCHWVSIRFTISTWSSHSWECPHQRHLLHWGGSSLGLSLISSFFGSLSFSFISCLLSSGCSSFLFGFFSLSLILSSLFGSGSCCLISLHFLLSLLSSNGQLLGLFLGLLLLFLTLDSLLLLHLLSGSLSEEFRVLIVTILSADFFLLLLVFRCRIFFLFVSQSF